MAGKADLERWKTRQRHSQEREAKALETRRARVVDATAHNNVEGEGAAKATASTVRNENTSMKPPVVTSKQELPSLMRGAPSPREGSGQGTVDGPAKGPQTGRRNRSRRGSGTNGDGSIGNREVHVVRCEGCNEEGHELKECPHRSDSALAESEEDEEELEEVDDDEDWDGE